YGRLHGRAMILNAAAALLGGATLALAAFDPRRLATRRDRQGAALLPERQIAPDSAGRVAVPLRSEG
ncbi:MAG: hypothetical protein U0841_35025, partial [Chloroflexia bacterium]